MSIKARTTIEDLYQVDGKAELVHGEIVEMPPTGDDPGLAGGEIFAHLRDYAKPRLQIIPPCTTAVILRRRNQPSQGGAWRSTPCSSSFAMGQSDNHEHIDTTDGSIDNASTTLNRYWHRSALCKALPLTAAND